MATPAGGNTNEAPPCALRAVGKFVGRHTSPQPMQADTNGQRRDSRAEVAGRGRTQRDAVGKRGLAFQDRCLQPLGRSPPGPSPPRRSAWGLQPMIETHPTAPIASGAPRDSSPGPPRRRRAEASARCPHRRDRLPGLRSLQTAPWQPSGSTRTGLGERPSSTPACGETRGVTTPVAAHADSSRRSSGSISRGATLMIAAALIRPAARPCWPGSGRDCPLRGCQCWSGTLTWYDTVPAPSTHLQRS
jgi:hypothetical protein